MIQPNQLDKLSVEKIIDLVRQVRNDHIKNYLAGDNIQSYFKGRHNTSISPVKIEFLSRDLRDLLIAPVDLVHYSTLIKEIRETNSTDLSPDLFYKEIEVIFSKYIY